MALEFKKGQIVTIKSPSIPTGPIVGFRVDSDGNVNYLVEWVDSAGEAQQRWFPESNLTSA
jgi:hypothetical protein